MTEQFQQLSDEQREAVQHDGGPMVVFAGAGSGKTRVITTRIATLIARGVRPWEILALTFTNKAAAEMRHRVQRFSPEGGRALITTFHSACARWLREYAQELGFDSNFTIFDDADTNTALKRIIRDVNPKGELPTILAAMKAFLNHVKTHALTPRDCEQLGDGIGIYVPPAGVSIYRRYQEFLSSCNAMDFGDLIMNMLLLLKNHPNVRQLMQQRYRHIMVDEYQDTNQTQLELINILADAHRNLVVVGDDDQSIYSWRGASPRNILDFKRVFPDARLVTLAQNYRSSANIVAAASHMIANNRTRAEKTLFSANPAGDLIGFRKETSAEMEAWWVASQIRKEQSRFRLDEVAIFYRTNSQSRSLEEALRRENIPYAVYGSLEFYDRREVKDLVAYIRFIVNERDEISLLRILNTPTRGLGDKAVETLRARAHSAGLGLFAAIQAEANSGEGRIAPKLRYFCDLLRALRKDVAATPLGGVVPLLMEALEYPEYLKKKFPDQFDDKIGNIHELAASMEAFSRRSEQPTLAEWLQSITLVREDSANDSTGVSLMTLHMAKGLEYERVYLVGVEDGILPHRNSMAAPSELEEERRLFYVGMTRAKQKLSLLCARERRTYQTTLANEPSRFLKELPRERLEMMNDQDSFVRNVREEALASPPSDYIYSAVGSGDAGDLTVGAMVEHPTYGRGVVHEIETDFGILRAVVRFFDCGMKKVKPTQLERVSSRLHL